MTASTVGPEPYQTFHCHYLLLQAQYSVHFIPASVL